MRLFPFGEIRLSEVISSLSVALDITEGQPAGHASRSCLIGMRIGRRIGLNEEQLGALFYGLLLKDLGCSRNAAKMCWLFGVDDRHVKKDIKTIDWRKEGDSFKFALSHAAPGASPIQKALQIATMARSGPKGARQLVETRCHRGADIAKMLGFPDLTADTFTALEEHWDGGGHPYGLEGGAIPLLGRIMCLAQTIEVFYREQGREAAWEVASHRRGTWFDPALVDSYGDIRHDERFWASLASDDISEEVNACEPSDQASVVTEEQLDDIALAFAMVVDAKSPWTAKHSEGVAEIAVGMAGILGYSPIMLRDFRRAGLLHDISKLGVSNMILDKPGRTTDEEFAEIKRHPRDTFEILNRVETFGPLTEIAGAHHEKLDGSGSHRGLTAEQLPMEARLLVVEDVCEALTAKRPYRDAMPLEKSREIMSREVGTGLCPDCYDALLCWQDRTTITPRVKAQLEAIEQLHSELA